MTARPTRSSLVLVVVAAVGMGGGCRGKKSGAPPVHVFDDMDWQQRYDPEEESLFFADRRAMRPPVPGTIPRGHLDEDDAWFRGRAGPGDDAPFVARVPATVDEKLMRRGEERFNIFCAPCHDRAGTGNGIVVQRGYHRPIDLAGERVRGLADGAVFHAISNGIRNMPAYRVQVPVEDRWAIVAWVRGLGRSQHASIDDVPGDVRDKIRPGSAAK